MKDLSVYYSSNHEHSGDESFHQLTLENRIVPNTAMVLCLQTPTKLVQCWPKETVI